MASLPQLTPSDVARFWVKVQKISNPNACWLWSKSVTKFGYGQLSLWCVDGTRSTFKAHRISYLIAHGAIPEGKVVRHKCDVPACVNPDHLEIGEQIENVVDMLRRERGKWAHGDKNGSRTRPDTVRRGEAVKLSKLTAKQVDQIRAEYQPGITTQRSIGDKYGVDNSTVSRIITKGTWK